MAKEVFIYFFCTTNLAISRDLDPQFDLILSDVRAEIARSPRIQSDAREAGRIFRSLIEPGIIPVRVTERSLPQTKVFLDAVIRLVLQRSIFKPVCAEWVDIGHIQNLLGVSAPTARQIANDCDGSFISPTTVAWANFWPFHSWFIAIEGSNRSKVKAWTSEANFTFLVVDPNEGLRQFVKSVAHELAIKFDRRANINSN